MKTYFIFLFTVATLTIQIPASGQEWIDLNEQSLIHYNNGKYDSSIFIGRRALSLAEDEFGTSHLNYLHTLNNIAYSYRTSGDLDRAAGYFRQILVNIEEVNSTNYQDFIETHINLGNTYCIKGSFDSCDYYLSKADQINKNPKNLSTNLDIEPQLIREEEIRIKNSQAILFGYKGQPYKAIENYKWIVEELDGQLNKTYDDSVTLNVLVNNLGTALTRVEAYDEAEIYLMRTLELQEQLGLTDSRGYLQTLNNLSSIYRYSDRLEKAKKLLIDVTSRISERYGKRNELYLTLLNNLGETYLEEENYPKAEELLEEAYRIQNENFSKHSRLYLHTVYNLAEAYHWDLKLNKAEEMYDVILGNILNDLHHNFTYLSEAEKRSFYLNHAFLIEGFELFALTRSGAMPVIEAPVEMLDQKVLGNLIDLRMATKGIVLNATSRMRKRILNSKDKNLIERYQYWESKKEELAQIHASIVIDQPQVLEDLKMETEEIEKQLAIASIDFKKGFEVDNISWGDIQKKLKPGEAAVEMIRYFDGLIYGALIITSETKDYPAMAVIRSTKSKHLEKQYFEYYRNAITYKIPDTTSYNRYWLPIRDTIAAYAKNKKIKKIYFSPDGIYHQVSLNSLKNAENDQFVLDEIELVRMSNLKELSLTRSRGKRKTNKLSALLLGRPAFSLSEDDSLPNHNSRSGNIYFSDLKATETEVRSISQQFSAKNWDQEVLTGSDASESSIKLREDFPEIVHFATHGYFKSPSDEEETQETASIVDYMLQSGIVLAGANDPITELENDDGILTSYEVSNLDLDQTELVVLSACETGLGKSESREGIYGLQRALKIAGVENVLMSLWKVDDQATQELMTTFYGSYLSHGDRKLAFREAQIKLREKYAEPYYWGAFVMIGN